MKYGILKSSVFTIFMALSSASSALTFVLDLDTVGSSDIFGSTTNAFDSSAFGFVGLSESEIRSGILDYVTAHFLDYPTLGENMSSPLPVGKELDIDFDIGNIGSAPTNMDSEYYFLQIGTAVPADPGLFGQACGSCVRDATGSGPNFGVMNGAVVGSIYTDAIASIVGFAGDNAQRFNLIAGTTSHEIGHTLTLAHAGAQDSNPGDSLWGVMGSGATSMPNNQRVLNREFTYSKFAQLISSVGLRDITVQSVSAPAMSGLILSIFACFCVYGRRTNQKASNV